MSRVLLYRFCFTQVAHSASGESKKLRMTTMNSTQHDTQYVGWVPVPLTRGTLDIVQTCVSTLFLCAYTTLHLNVPDQGETFWQKTWYSAKWVCIGVLAPEVVLACAAKELAAALLLQERVKNISCEACASIDAKERPDNVTATCDCKQKRDRWTLQHSFFAIMGGYRLRLAEERDINDDAEKAMTTRRVIRLHADCVMDAYEHCNDFSLPDSESLSDRSKMTSFIKIVSYYQAVWLCIQVVGRLAGHLAVTELEGNTIAHVLCSFACAVLWLRKPYNVQSAETIELESDIGWYIAGHLGLLLLNSSPARTNFPDPASIVNDAVVFEGVPSSSKIREWSELPHERCVVVILQYSKHDYATLRSFFQAVRKATLDVHAQNFPRIMIYINLPQDFRDTTFFDFERFCLLYTFSPSYIKVNGTELSIVNSFWHGRNAQRMQHLNHARASVSSESNQKSSLAVQATSKSIRSIDPDYEVSATQVTLAFAVLAGVSLVYGGLHLAFWNAHLPSLLEIWFWRFSALTVTCICPIGLALTLLMAVLWSIKSFAERFSFWESVRLTLRSPGTQRQHKRFIAPAEFLGDIIIFISVKTALALTLWILGPLLAIARLYLVTESFVSLRSQPPSAFQQVVWAKFIPHV